jgi:hypothetical protein
VGVCGYVRDTTLAHGEKIMPKSNANDVLLSAILSSLGIDKDKVLAEAGISTSTSTSKHTDKDKAKPEYAVECKDSKLKAKCYEEIKKLGWTFHQVKISIQKSSVTTTWTVKKALVTLGSHAAIERTTQLAERVLDFHREQKKTDYLAKVDVETEKDCVKITVKK